MDFYTFALANPWLVFFLAIIAGLTLVSIVEDILKTLK